MQIRVLAVGRKMPGWVQEAQADYLKRMPREYRVSIVEVPQSREATAMRRIASEGESLLAKVGQRDLVIALDVKGSSWSTGEFAEKLQLWKAESHTVSLLIGGPDGLAKPCVERASLRWSLSALTLPHPMVRVVLAEQLYRAHSILVHHPYHRA